VFPGNDHLELRVLDPAEKSVRRVQVPPHFPPMRVGISWRSSTAEPGVFYLITVIPGSPADLAGLHPGDRLYAVNGRTIFSSEELQRVFAELVGSTEVLIERRGQLITRILELP
jgi:membrane-associated protease RseP (regulator of RpoE activity)